MALRVNHPQYGNIFLVGSTFADLRSIPVRKLLDGYVAVINGRSASGDGFGGIFVWNAALQTSDDNSTTIAPDPTVPGRWFLLASNATGATGKDGDTGPTGAASSAVLIYQRASSAPAKPTTNATYTFSSKTLTGLNQGWSSTIPTGALPIWVCAATAADNGTGTATILGSEWSAPVILSQNGVSTASVYLYQRKPLGSTPSVPSSTVTYTFTPPTVSGLTNGWQTTIPVTGTDPIYVTVATAISGTGQDTIDPTEWSPVAILAQNGSAGQTGAAGRNAIVYNQDATPTNPQAGDTWYSQTTKLWQEWNGQAWVPLLGNLARFDAVAANMIAVNSLGAISANIGQITAGQLMSADQQTSLNLDTNSFTFAANDFRIVSPGAPSIVPFSVVNGATYINTAIIGDLTVGTSKLVNGAVSQAALTRNTNSFSIAGGNMVQQNVWTYNLNLPYAANISIDYSGRQSYTGFNNNDPWDIFINVDGTQINSRGGAGFGSDVISCIGAYNGLAAGPHALTVNWRTGSSYITLVDTVIRLLVTYK